jgi:hypothetical protein
MKSFPGSTDKTAIRAHSDRLALAVDSYRIDKMSEKATGKLIYLYLKAAYLLFQMHTLVYLQVHFITSLSFFKKIIP